MANVEQLFREYMKRRDGLLKALTTESTTLYKRCNPHIEDDLYLYGLLNGEWELWPETAPVLPTDFIKPKKGINSVRTNTKQWLIDVATHCDSWLLGVALYAAETLSDGKDRRQFRQMTDKVESLARVVRREAVEKTVDTCLAMSLKQQRKSDSRVEMPSEATGKRVQAAIRLPIKTQGEDNSQGTSDQPQAKLLKLGQASDKGEATAQPSGDAAQPNGAAAQSSKVTKKPPEK